MERCETCRFWLLQYNSEYGFTKDLDNESGEPNEKTDYGECRKAISIYGSEDTESLNDMIKAKKPMLTLDSEQYGGAWLYTYKNHCCRCWQSSGFLTERKEG